MAPKNKNDRYLFRMGEAVERFLQAVIEAGRNPDEIHNLADDIEDAEGGNFRIEVVCDSDEVGTNETISFMPSTTGSRLPSPFTRVAAWASAQAA